MTFDSPIAEKGLRITSRFMHQRVWLLLPIAAAMTGIVRRGAPGSTAYLWFLGCGFLAFMLVRRKLGYRDTQDKLVRDVKTFLEKQSANLADPPAPLKPADVPKVVAVPHSGPADFVSLQVAAAFRRPAGDPVVFDAFPSRKSVAVRMDFRTPVLPAEASC
jgi:hypothetical protein